MAATDGHWGSGWTMGTSLDIKQSKDARNLSSEEMPLYFTQGLLLPSKYVLDCLGAGCAGGVSTGRRTGSASGRRTSGARGGGTVEDLHLLLLLPDLHLQRLILLSPKLDASHPVTSGPCCRLTVAALAARSCFPTLGTVAILLTSCCR